MALRQADHSSRGVLAIVVRLEYDREVSIMKTLWPTRGCCAMGEKKFYETMEIIFNYIHF
jgi:hypothetical protein